MSGLEAEQTGLKRKRRPKKPFIPPGAAPYLHTFSSTASAAPLRKPKLLPDNPEQTVNSASGPESSQPIASITDSFVKPASGFPHTETNQNMTLNPNSNPNLISNPSLLASEDCGSEESFNFPGDHPGQMSGPNTRLLESADYTVLHGHGPIHHSLQIGSAQGYQEQSHANEASFNPAMQATMVPSALMLAHGHAMSLHVNANTPTATIHPLSLHAPFAEMQRRLREAATESAYIALATRMQSFPSAQPLSLPSIGHVVGQPDPNALQGAVGLGSGLHHATNFSSKTHWKSGPGNIDLYQHGLYFALLENSPVPTLVCESDKVLYANKAVCHLFGYLEPELLRMGSISDFVDPSEKEAFQKFWVDSSKSVDIVQCVRRCVHKIGYAITCLWRCRLVHGQNGSVIIASIQDILQAIMHMRLDRPLSDIAGCSTLSSEIFRDAFVFSHGALAIIGSTDRFLHVNITFCDLLGYTRQELIEKYWYEILPWDEVKSSRVKMKQCRQSSSGRGDFFECRCLKKSGASNSLMMRFSIMKDRGVLSSLLLYSSAYLECPCFIYKNRT